ncbi:hypothetical protein GCM10020255_010330 [Rhodococcus baikonurensis]
MTSHPVEQTVDTSLAWWDARTDQVSRGQLESELRPFAHLYGAPLGDGAGLIAAIIDDVAASDLMPTPADIESLSPGGSSWRG